MKKLLLKTTVFLAFVVFLSILVWDIRHFSIIEKPTLVGSVALSPLPNPTLTPGATNPDITEANMDQTICNPHWSTKSIRPSTSYTNKLKASQIKAYGYSDTNMALEEEDHLISLELGGSPTDPKNLWPEPYNIPLGARQKDKVENYLHDQVCSGNITLEDAQYQISHDWVSVYKEMQ